MMQTTDEKMMAIAAKVSKHSTDPNRKVGAVIANGKDVVSLGFNNFPLSFERTEDRDKDLWTVHAEIMDISRAALEGEMVLGCTMYSTYFPCASCAGAIIEAQVHRVVAPEPDLSHSRWGKHWKIALEMFKLADVQVDLYPITE